MIVKNFERVRDETLLFIYLFPVFGLLFQKWQQLL